MKGAEQFRGDLRFDAIVWHRRAASDLGSVYGYDSYG